MNQTLQRLSPYAERVAENEYLQESLREAAENLRGAYGRISKRKADAARDDKFYAQVRQAAEALTEAKEAFLTGRTKPKRGKRRMLLVLAAGAGLAAAVAAAQSEDIKELLLGDSDGDA